MTASGLPLDVATTGTGENSNRKVAESDELAARCAMTRRSALWAAYGDALGWISELTDSTGLNRRTGGAPLFPTDGLDSANRRTRGNHHVPAPRMLLGRFPVAVSPRAGR